MKDRNFEQLSHHIDNGSLRDFSLNAGEEVERNIQVMLDASIYLLHNFPANGEKGSAPYEFSSLTWNFKKAVQYKDNPFDPREVHSAIKTLIKTIADGKVKPNFDQQTSNDGTELDPAKAFSIQFDTRYDGTDKYSYAQVNIGPNFANAFESPKTRGEALARLYASGNLIEQIENELASLSGDFNEEEPIMPILKVATTGIGKMLVRHQGFRAFYSIMQRQEANPY